MTLSGLRSTARKLFGGKLPVPQPVMNSVIVVNELNLVLIFIYSPKMPRLSNCLKSVPPTAAKWWFSQRRKGSSGSK